MGKWLKRLALWLPWLLAAVILLLVLQFVSFAAVGQSLQALRPWQLLLLIGLNGIILVLLTGRWWLLLRGLGYRLPFSQALGHRLAAFGVTYLTPGPQFGGEPAQVLLAERVNDVSRVTAVSSVSLDKTLELLVNFTFLTLGVLLAVQLGLFEQPVWSEPFLFTTVLLLLPLLYLSGLWRGRRPLTHFMQLGTPLFKRHPSRRIWFEAARHGLADSEDQAGRMCRHSPQTVFAALLMSLAGWGLMLVEYGLLLTFLGAELTAVEIILMMTAARLAFLLPFPAGLGSLEASQIFTLGLLGQNPAIAVSAVLLIRGRDLLLAFLGLWWGSWFFRRTLQDTP